MMQLNSLAVSFSRRVAVVTMAAWVTSALAQPEPISLKGHEIDAEMTECPAETVQTKEQRDGSIFCVMPATTLAGEAVASSMVQLWQGRVVASAVLLPRKGGKVGIPIVNALIEKYGPPTEAKPHINRYVWHRGSHALSFDGYSGVVIATNTDAQDALRKIAARKNKTDL